MKNPIENICFVMMPFGDPFDDYYVDIYQPAIEENGFKSKRADSLFRPSPIIKDIWEYINNSKILIADITDLNPNVMYELGLAHAIAKPVILISDSTKNVPFDLRLLRILIYNTKKPSWSIDLKTKISNSIKEIIESPTDSILQAFLSIKPKLHESEQITSELIEIKQLIMNQLTNEDKGILKGKLTKEIFINAKKDSYRLYYEDGWEIGEIKKHLMKKYNLSQYTADDIFHKSI